MNATRGVVLASRVVGSDDGRHNWPPQQEDILFALTYWDVLVVPSVGGIRITERYGYELHGDYKTVSIGVGNDGFGDDTLLEFPDCEVLVDEGILLQAERDYPEARADPQRFYDIVNVVNLFREVPYELCNAWNEQTPMPGVVWDLAHPSEAETLDPPSQIGEAKDGVDAQQLVIALRNALPTPRTGTELKRILEFRNKHRRELLEFRLAMDQLVDSIVQSSDQPRALVRAKETIEHSLLTIAALLDQGRIARVASTLKSYLSLSEPDASKLIWPALGAATASAAHISPAWGGLAGLGVNAALTFLSRRTTPAPALTSELKPYVYLYNVAKLG